MEESDPPSPPERDDFQGGRSPGRSSKRNRAHPYERIPQRGPRTNDTPISMVSDGAITSSRISELNPPSTSQSDDTLNLQQRLHIRQDINPSDTQNPGPSDQCSLSDIDIVSQIATGSPPNTQVSMVKRCKPTSPPEPAITLPGGSLNEQDLHQKAGPSNTKKRHHPYERNQVTKDQGPKTSRVRPPCFGKKSCDCYDKSLSDLTYLESITRLGDYAETLPLHSSDYYEQLAEPSQTTSPALSPSEGLMRDSEPVEDPMSSEGLPEIPRIQESALLNEERLDDQGSVTLQVPHKPEGDNLKTFTSDVSTLDDRNIKEHEENVSATTSRTKQIPSVLGYNIEPNEIIDDPASSENSEMNLETSGSPSHSMDRLQDAPMLADSASLNVERSEDQEYVSFVGAPRKQEKEALDIPTEDDLISDDLNLKESLEIDQREDDFSSSDDPEINLDPVRSSTPLKGLQDVQLLDSSLPNVEEPQDQESATCQNRYGEDSKTSSKCDHSYASTAPGSPENTPNQDQVHAEKADDSSSSDSEMKLEQPGSPTPSERFQATPMLTDPAFERSEDQESATCSKVAPKTYDSKSSSKHDHSYASTGAGSPENPPKQEQVLIDSKEPNERVDDSTSSEDSELKLEQPGSPTASSESLQDPSMLTDSPKTYEDDSKSSSNLDHSPSSPKPGPSEPNRETLDYVQVVCESFMQMETFALLNSVCESFMNMDPSQREKNPADQELVVDGFDDRDVSSSDNSF